MNKDESTEDLLEEQMGRVLEWYWKRYEEKRLEVEQLQEKGFSASDAIVARVQKWAELRHDEYKRFERAVKRRPPFGSRKGAIDDWLELAQGRIPELALGRGRPKNPEVALRKEAAIRLRVFFEDADPEGFEVWIAWKGVLRLWHTLNPGKTEPFIEDQIGWLVEAEKQARELRHSGGDPSLSGTRKFEHMCELLLKRLECASSQKQLGP